MPDRSLNARSTVFSLQLLTSKLILAIFAITCVECMDHRIFLECLCVLLEALVEDMSFSNATAIDLAH